MKLSWVHMFSYDFVIQVQSSASPGQLVGNSKTILMNLGWLFSFKKKPRSGQFLPGFQFHRYSWLKFFKSNKSWRLGFSPNIHIFKRKKKKNIIFWPHYFLWKKFKKILQDQKGKRIRAFSVAYKIHLLFTSRHFLVLFGQPQQVFWLVTSDCCVL